MTTLFCNLINGDGDHEFAIVRLSQEYIEKLLSIVAEAECINVKHPSLFALEFMDNVAAYYPEETKLPYAAPPITPGWSVLEPDCEPDELEPATMCADTIVVTTDGIVWKAAAKHGDERYFETPLLDVATLHKLHTDNLVTITVKGGMVVDVEGLPESYEYEINDQDC
jgi:hypothetical protein